MIGNQKCRGAVTNFRKSAKFSKILIFLIEKFSVRSAALISITELSDCITKYFKALSLLLLLINKIMNPSKFISIPNHPTHQELDDRVIAVPLKDVVKNRKKLLIIKGL